MKYVDGFCLRFDRKAPRAKNRLSLRSKGDGTTFV